MRKLFLDLILFGGEWSYSCLDHFNHGEVVPSAHCIGTRVDRKAGVDVVEKRKFFTIWRLKL